MRTRRWRCAAVTMVAAGGTVAPIPLAAAAAAAVPQGAADARQRNYPRDRSGAAAAIAPAPAPASRRRLKVNSPCKRLYEYSNFLGVLGNVTYTGSQKPEPNVGQFNTPVFDDANLQGDPVGRLRGSYLEDVVSHFATFVAAFELYGSSSAESEYLVVSLGFSTSPASAGRGVALGGTGQWSGYRGAVVSEPFNVSSWTSDDAEMAGGGGGPGGAVPVVFRYTVCR